MKSQRLFGLGSIVVRMTAPMMLALILLPAMTARAANAIYQISENGHHLVNSTTGEPFFWQGDTEWELLYLLSAEDAKALLHARRLQGFTVVQAMCDGIFPKWIAHDKLPPLQELMPWANDNPRTPNEAFFTRMDAIIAAAQEEHLLLLIGVYSAEDVKAKRVTLANIGAWTRWLAHRYKDVPNIVWTMYSALDPESIPLVREAVTGLKEGDAGSHLVTLHPEGAPGSSSAVKAELSLNTFQSLSTGYLNYQLAQADYARTPAKPVVNGEARYEGEDGTTAFDVRRSAWWSYLGGAAFSYGHINNWSPDSWREWVNAPGAEQFQVVGAFLRSLAWWKLIPDQSILVDGGEGAAARSADGDWIVAYLPTNSPVTLRLNAITSYKTALVSWINPYNGAKTQISRYPISARVSLTPPGDWQDAVLVAEPYSTKRTAERLLYRRQVSANADGRFVHKDSQP